MTTGKTALIYFSRSAEAEAKEKCWSPRSTKSERIAISRFLIQQTAKALRNTDLDLISFDEDCQQSKDFGENIVDAFSHAFDLGYERALLVGNDCLALKEVDWKLISGKLQSGQSVLGPTYRKGAYLIGLHHNDFHRSKFQNLRWQTSYLLEDLQAYFEEQGLQVIQLEVQRDINHWTDFLKVLSSVRLRAKDIASIKSFIVQNTRKTIVYWRSFYFSAVRTTIVNKGPPALI